MYKLSAFQGSRSKVIASASYCSCKWLNKHSCEEKWVYIRPSYWWSHEARLDTYPISAGRNPHKGPQSTGLVTGVARLCGRRPHPRCRSSLQGPLSSREDGSPWLSGLDILALMRGWTQTWEVRPELDINLNSDYPRSVPALGKGGQRGPKTLGRCWGTCEG